ncbi:MAG: type II toxin-antitoxin system RelE/ParE family toxin [Actinobacteria bacterium]|nr:type II toxin-antitoxin system RelE/ParE family toxin [Actinomycetota bacterium]
MPEYPALPFREVIVGPYRFFYQAKVDAVWIVAVWHGAQLVEPPDDVVGG